MDWILLDPNIIQRQYVPNIVTYEQPPLRSEFTDRLIKFKLLKNVCKMGSHILRRLQILIILTGPIIELRAKRAESIQRLAADWKLRGLNSGGSKRFSLHHKSPEWPCGPPRVLYHGYRGFFPGIKRPGRGVEHQSFSSADDKHGQSYTSTILSVPELHVTGWHLQILN
jgi:hypothetical protein